MEKFSWQPPFSGKSMQPAILPGDQIEINPLPNPQPLSEFSVGSVVLLRDDEEWVIHRVVETKNGVRTKGDWSLHYDETNNIWGKVTMLGEKDSPLLRSRKIAFLSNLIHKSQPRWKRQWARCCLFLLVGFYKLQGYFR